MVSFCSFYKKFNSFNIAATHISFSSTNVYSYWYFAIINIAGPTFVVNLSKLSYNALNRLLNSLEPESANIWRISDNVDLFDNVWIIYSFKSSFNDDSSSFTT